MTLTASGLIHAMPMDLRYKRTYQKSGCYINNCRVNVRIYTNDAGDPIMEVTHNQDVKTFLTSKELAKEYIAWALSLHGII